ncbi:MAG: DUF1674 domain-containing protein [Nevskia sp.]|nr:DUF1674 domain-containing protein [Nevskia sp.]
MNSNSPSNTPAQAPASAVDAPAQAGSADLAVAPVTAAPRELGGRKDGTEPTRFGDWEKHGRCIDF